MPDGDMLSPTSSHSQHKTISILPFSVFLDPTAAPSQSLTLPHFHLYFSKLKFISITIPSEWISD